MTDMNKKPLLRKRLLKFFLIKFPIILLVLGLIFYMTLKIVERYPIPLREGLEQYLSSSFGVSASIGTLEKFAFVPNIDIDLGDVTLHRNNNAAKIDLKVERVKVSIPFWAAFFGKSKFKTLDIQNVVSGKDIVLPRAFNFKSITIIDEEGPKQYGSFLVATGTYAAQNFNFEAQIQKQGSNYSITSNVPFALIMGDTKLTGTINRNLRNMTMTNTMFEIKGKKDILGDYVLAQSNAYTKNNPLYCLMVEANGEKCLKDAIQNKNNNNNEKSETQ